MPSVLSVSAKCSDDSGKLILCCKSSLFLPQPNPHPLNFQGCHILIFTLFLCLTWAGESSWILSVSHRIQERVMEWAWISRYSSVWTCSAVIYTQKQQLHVKHHTARLSLSKIQTRSGSFSAFIFSLKFGGLYRLHFSGFQAFIEKRKSQGQQFNSCM